MISQRDVILLETVSTLKAQFDSMTEEVSSLDTHMVEFRPLIDGI